MHMSGTSLLLEDGVDCLLTLDNRHDRALLDGRGTLETIRIDTYTVLAYLRSSDPYPGVTAFIPLRSSGLRFIASKESVISS